ncbi:MAG: ABC transporter permease [Chloroflexi bacterium]|nr:ABC transporter permease [Chloroflexota bacterium]
MRKTMAIARHEFLVTLRRRSFQVMTLLLPALALVGVFGFQAIQGRVPGTGPEARFGYVDGSGLFGGHREQPGALFTQYPSLEAARADLLGREIDAVYVFPASYMETGNVVKYTADGGLDMERDLPRPLKGFILANLLEGAPAQVAERVGTPAIVSTVRLASTGEPSPVDAGRVVFFFGTALLLVMSIFMSSGFLLQGIVEEKENRIMEVLLSSVNTAQLMVGKVLGLGAAGLTQVGVWLASALLLTRLASATIPLLSGLSFPGVLGLVGLLYFVLGYFLFSALLAALGSISTTAREGQQISGLFVMPALVPIYAWPYIVAHPDSGLSLFLTLFPLTAPVTVMQRIGAGSIAAWEVAGSALVLVAAALSALWAAGRLFRAYLLMYGKRPGLVEIWRALRR